VATWAVGQHVRDEFWLSALCFYLPSPLVAILLLGIAGAAARWGCRRTAVAAALWALAPALSVAVIENHWTSPAPPKSTGCSLRLVHWNVARGRLGPTRVTDRLAATEADAYVVSEASGVQALLAFAHRLGGEFTLVRIWGLAFLARGKLGIKQNLRLAGGGHAHTFLWLPPTGPPLKLLVVDLSSSVLAHRDPLLRRLRELIAAERPDIVVGDLNAPRRSLALASLPVGYHHAYDAAGSGWSYTWPAPFPLWAIDQCILGPRVRATRYTLRSTTASDHRMQILDFTLCAAGG